MRSYPKIPTKKWKWVPSADGQRMEMVPDEPAPIPVVPEEKKEEIVWDPIMSRWVPESKVYIAATTPPGEKKVTPWETPKLANRYKNYLGIPAYTKPETTTRPDTETTQTSSTTLGGVVQVKWFHAKAATGKDIYVDWKKGSHQFAILTENKTIHLVNPYPGLFCLSIWQDTTGGWTLTWAINDGLANSKKPVVFWPSGVQPTMSAAASSHDMYSFAWLPFIVDAGSGLSGAYEGMTTQDMRVPT
jgi:hypothetical protein